MAISELKAILSLDMGTFKSSLSTAKSSMDSMAKTTKDSMDSINNSSQKSQGILSKGFGKLASDGDKFKNQQDSLGKKMAKTAFGFVGITSAASIFNKAIGRVDKIQSAEAAIAQLTGSQEKATIVMDGLQNVVDGTPLSLDSFTASAKGMVAAGMEVDKVEGVMTAVGDAAYGVGEGAPSIDIMASAFKSLQASGTASLGDLNRLADQNIPVYKILGNQMGKSTEDMKKFISDGLLPSEEAMDLLVKGIEEGTDGINGSTTGMAGQMSAAGETISGASSNIATAIVKVLAVPITEAYEKIVTGLNSVKDGIKTFQPFLISVFTGMTEIIEGVILGIVDTFNMLKPAFDGVITVIKNLVGAVTDFMPEGTNLKDLVQRITPIIVALFAAFQAYKVIAMTAHSLSEMTGIFGLLSNPITLVVAAIAAFAAGILYLWNTNESFKNAVIDLWESIKEAFTVAIEYLTPYVTEAWNNIKAVFDIVMPVIKAIVQNAWTAIQGIITGVLNVISGVVKIFSALLSGDFSKLWDGIKQVASGAWTAIKSMLTGNFNNIKAIAGAVFKGMATVISGVWDNIKSNASTKWNAVKSAMTKPIESAVNIIKGLIDKVKGFFSNMKLSFPKLSMPPLPHFSLNGKFSLKPPSVPRLNVNWYETGGIATGPSVVGIGENGSEAILPLSNKARMKPFAQTVSSYMADGSGSGRNISADELRNLVYRTTMIEVPVEVGKRRLAHVLVDDITDLQDRKTDNEFRREGLR